MQEEPQQFPETEPALYLIPTPLSPAPLDRVLPDYNTHILSRISDFIVENVREARRFIRRVLPKADIDAMTFAETNRHSDMSDASSWLQPLREGRPMGLLSDAGAPAVADPGAAVVAIAQAEGLKVVPLVGPSSILLSLMASGFNGQGFAFHGYLPINKGERAARLRALEISSAREDMTHIFIETPYRNSQMLACMTETLRPDTRICPAGTIQLRPGDRVEIIGGPFAGLHANIQSIHTPATGAPTTRAEGANPAEGATICRLLLPGTNGIEWRIDTPTLLLHKA